jgi:hypothetical protein
MPLHDGLPLKATVNPDYVLEYMQIWAGNMTSDIHMVTSSGRGDGIFNPACLIHTGFGTTGPLIDGRNYLAALGDWMYKV